MRNNDGILLGNGSMFQQMTNNKTERELKLESVVYANKAPWKPNSDCRWLAFGDSPARLTREPFRINLDLSFCINFTSGKPSSRIWTLAGGPRVGQIVWLFSGFQYFYKTVDILLYGHLKIYKKFRH